MQLLDMMSNDQSPTVEIQYSHINKDSTISPEKSEKLTAILKRSTEKVSNPVQYTTQKLKNGKIAGYIRLSEFNSQAVPGLKEAIVDLNSKNIDELLLDLRGEMLMF